MKVICIDDSQIHITGFDIEKYLFLGKKYEAGQLTGIYSNLYWIELPERTTFGKMPRVLVLKEQFITVEEHREQQLDKLI